MTSRPGLWYFDVNKTLDYKGTIPWSEKEPVKIRRIGDNKFDIVSGIGTDGERSYHLTDHGGCDGWLKALREFADETDDSKMKK